MLFVSVAATNARRLAALLSARRTRRFRTLFRADAEASEVSDDPSVNPADCTGAQHGHRAVRAARAPTGDPSVGRNRWSRLTQRVWACYHGYTWATRMTDLISESKDDLKSKAYRWRRPERKSADQACIQAATIADGSTGSSGIPISLGLKLFFAYFFHS